MDALSSLALGLGSGIVGFIGGMVFESQKGLRQRRVQQELWDRKFRLAEADREAAVAALNQNNIDVKKIRSTFDEQGARIAELEKTERQRKFDEEAARRER